MIIWFTMISIWEKAKNAISIERKRELDLYKRYASDADFKRAFDATIARLLVTNSADFRI